MSASTHHSLPIGAEPGPDSVRFRVWAEGRETVAVVIDGKGEHPLVAEPDGYFSAIIASAEIGDHYRYRLDGSAELLADPASRWQPDGPSGSSVVCDSDDFSWTDAQWQGVPRHGQVLYEMHIGTFTPEGTWNAAQERLGHLQDVGVTALQIMPIGEFGGRFGWGYDTVLPYAPSHHYGTPDEVKSFVDAAHHHGIGVLLDVVYNHVGLGDRYGDFSAHYFTHRHPTEWGAGFNFDGRHAAPVREFIVENAAYWIREYHFDGLRLDATQALFDDGPDHIIAEIGRAARLAGGERSIYLAAENQPEERQLIDPPEVGGYGLDAIANDDFHHAAHVALTGHNDFYYRDYFGTAQELVSSAKYGFLYQGQRSDMRDAPYGTFNLRTAPEHFIHFTENHDQIANSARGLRLSGLASPARNRAITVLLLLSPQTPCLFQGQEFATSGVFYYFAGYDGDEAEAVREGRKKSLLDFPSVADPAMTAELPDPAADATFAASKLDWSECGKNNKIVQMHRDLLAMRRSDPAFNVIDNRAVDGAVLGDTAFVLRFTLPDAGQDRLLLINLGRDLPMGTVPEPLLAPPDGSKWVLHWSSEDPAYAGAGRRPMDTDNFWVLPADTAIVLAAEPRPKR